MCEVEIACTGILTENRSQFEFGFGLMISVILLELTGQVLELGWFVLASIV
jgi:hypothetical protein